MPEIARTDADLYTLEREPFLLVLTGHTRTLTTSGIIDQRLDELGTRTAMSTADRPGTVGPAAETRTEFATSDDPGAKGIA